jgi:uncharacterized delta-60 repeat protein
MRKMSRKTNRNQTRRILIEAVERRTLMSVAPIFLDPSYGANGVASAPAIAAGYGLISATMPGTGSVVVAGYGQGIDTALVPYELQRYSSTGAIDTSFGVNGLVTTNIKADPVAMIVQSDGGILVLAQNQTAGGVQYFLTLYSSNGTVNDRWNRTGTAEYQTGVTHFNPDYATTIVQLPGGDIALPGYVTSAGATLSAVMVLDGAGVGDPSFGENGLAIGVVGTLDNLAIDTNGNLIAVGHTNTDVLSPNGATGQGLIERFTRVGQFDPTFGTEGATISADAGTFNTVYVGSTGIDAVGPPSAENGEAVFNHYKSNGLIDSSFGNESGYVTVSSPQVLNLEQSVFQPDGKLILPGAVSSGEGAYVASVTRLNPDGSLDENFGFDGVANLGPVLSTDPNSGGVSLEANGSIVVLGSATYGAIDGLDFDPSRLLSNGTPDTSFGPNGVAPGRPLFTTASAITELNNGQTLTAGQVTVGGEIGIYLRRFNTNGLLDTTFATGEGYDGQSGYVFLGPDVVATQFVGHTVGGLTTDSSGNIYIGENGIGIIKLSSTGTLATSDFGTQGTAPVPIAGNFLREANGQILVTTTTGALTRLNSDGLVDTTFGKSGIVTMPSGFTLTDGVLAIQSNGEILVGGTSIGAPASTDLTVLRLNANGSVDTTFGTAGLAIADKLPSESNEGFRQEYEATPAALAVLSNGTIVVAGTDGGDDGVASAFSGPTIAEFLPTGKLNTAFGTGGQTSTYNPVRLQFTIVNSLIVQPDGTLVEAGTENQGEPAEDSLVFLLRYDSNGSVDSFVNTAFVASNSNNPTTNNVEQDAVAGPNGTVVLSGNTNSAFYFTDALLARYTTDAVLPVSGTVYSDYTGDPSNFKTGVAGQVVYADLNNNSKLDPGEPSAISNSSGQYTLTGLPAGPVIIREVLVNKRQSYPAGGSGEHITVGAVSITGVNFGVTTDLYVSGTVRSSASKPIAGVVVYADLNKDGKLDNNELSTITAADGTFNFKTLIAGTYVFRVVAPKGYTQTTPASNGGISVTLGSGGVDTKLAFSLSTTTASASSILLTELDNQSIYSSLVGLILSGQ